MANRPGTFVSGDPRANRSGRPKNADNLAALFRKIGHELATDEKGEPILGPDGKPMTRIEKAIRETLEDPKQRALFFDRGWGKVPERLAGEDGGRLIIEVREIGQHNRED